MRTNLFYPQQYLLMDNFLLYFQTLQNFLGSSVIRFPEHVSNYRNKCTQTSGNLNFFGL